MTATATHQHRLLVSPDGMRGANVHPLDAPSSLHTGWTDCIDLNDDEFHNLVVQRQLAHLHAEGARP